MINKFKYSYISYENDTPWNEDPVVDLSLSYSSYNIQYLFRIFSFRFQLRIELKSDILLVIK